MTPIHVESLEARQLLAADAGLSILPYPLPWPGDWDVQVTLNNDGALTIHGTHQRDVVLVSREGDKIFVEHYTVPPPGVYRPQIMMHEEFDAAAVNFIVFRGRGDADLFENATDVRCYARGGAGADELIGGNASDLLLGGRGRDTLVGGLGQDWLWGGLGQDRLDGQDGVHDVLIGGMQNDELLGDADLDLMIQGLGFQYFLQSEMPQPIGPPEVFPLPVIELTPNG